MLDALRCRRPASIGIAYRIDAAPTSDELLRNADLAMYTAKAGGKNCCRVFDREMHLRRGRTARSRSPPARRSRARRAHGALPADLRAASGAHHRGRGARPLAAPRSRTARPAVVHPVRRGGRPDRRDRPARAARPRARKRRGGSMPSATRPRRRSASTSRRASSSTRVCPTGRVAARPERPRPGAADPRDHRRP